jgi:DoxX-like family
MNTSIEPPGIASRYRFLRWRAAAYWLATAAVVAEQGVGGIWDITRMPSVRELVTHLGYPSYFLVLLGIWKVLGAAALLVPRRALLKEWAYAGAFFTYTGAIVSHLATGYALSEVGVLALMTALTVLSWALRPPSRRTPRPAPGIALAAVARGTPGVARAIPVPGHAAADADEADSSATQIVDR